jgi:hypothetical protein
MPSPFSLVHWLVWRDPKRRAQNLLRFRRGGGRRRPRPGARRRGDQGPAPAPLFLKHALDEQRHADLFRSRGLALIRTLPRPTAGGVQADWLTPGERGLDDLRVEDEGDAALLAFLHLSEKRGAATSPTTSPCWRRPADQARVREGAAR